ncbi:unnamed protein product [Ophioblennius macclurei]
MHMFTDESDYTDVHTFQTVVDMFGRNPGLQRIIRHSLGLEYDAHFGFPDDDDDDDDDYNGWVHHHRNFRGPLRRFEFSDARGHYVPSSNAVYHVPRNFRAPSPNISSLSIVEAQLKENDTESKARLVQETKKSKAKAEKKKKKKLKQKERKRREKEEKEKQNAAKNEAKGDAAQRGEEAENKAGCDEDGAGADTKSSGKPAAQAEDSDSSGGSEPESSDNDDDNDSKYDSCASEELDMTSSFVSKAALIAKRKMEQKPKPVKSETKVANKEEVQAVHNKPNESQEAKKKDSAAASSSTFEDHVKISNDLAEFGNKCASTGDYNMAVKFFTDAIKYNPKEFKLFGNRSFCFEKLQEYEKALTDAELSLGISPGWVKGLFRKGRALAGLKRYDEAAQAFRDVLKQDSMCAEAAQELMRVQIIQLMELGFTREQSSNALIIHGTVKKASEVLSKLQQGTGGVRNVSPPSMQVANVTGVSPVLSAILSPAPPISSPPAAAAAAAAAAAPAAQPQRAAKTTSKNKPLDPARELFPIWVGNLNFTMTESVIINLFSKAGTVASVKVLNGKRCAFVNFTDQESCEDAIRRFHGYELNGAVLAVRYPDRIAPGMNISKSALRASPFAR